MGQLELRDLLSDVAGGVEPAGPDLVDRALSQARRRRAVRLAAVPAAALVAALAAATLMLPQARTDSLQPAAPSENVPAMPRKLPGFSLLTAHAKDAPAGRALAILDYYYRDTPRVVALGADANTHRRLGPDGDALYFGGAALSPDGTRAALALPGEAISIQDLRTGRITSLRPASTSAGDRRARIGFAPDGDTVLVIRTDQGAALVNARTGAETKLLAQTPDEFAFSPDGQRIAVQFGGLIRIVDRTGKTLREIDIASTGARIGSTQAWSPDGRFLVTVHAPGGGNVPYTFRFVATDGDISATDVPPARIITDGSMVAWRNNQEILVQERTGDASVLTVRGVRSGSRTVLADLGGASVSFVAADLIGTAGSRPAGDPDFGPWPTWLVIASVAGAALLVLLVLRRIRRRLSPGGPA
jgi:hypothetical protein